MPPCSTRIVTPQSRFPPRKPFTRMQALAKSKTITARWLELPLESVQKPFHEPQSGQVITVSFRCNPRGRVGVVHHHEHGAVLPSPPLHFPLPRQQSPLFLQKALQRVKCRFSVRWRAPVRIRVKNTQIVELPVMNAKSDV